MNSVTPVEIRRLRGSLTPRLTTGFERSNINEESPYIFHSDGLIDLGRSQEPTKNRILINYVLVLVHNSGKVLPLLIRGSRRACKSRGCFQSSIYWAVLVPNLMLTLTSYVALN